MKTLKNINILNYILLEKETANHATIKRKRHNYKIILADQKDRAHYNIEKAGIHITQEPINKIIKEIHKYTHKIDETMKEEAASKRAIKRRLGKIASFNKLYKKSSQQGHDP